MPGTHCGVYLRSQHPAGGGKSILSLRPATVCGKALSSKNRKRKPPQTTSRNDISALTQEDENRACSLALVSDREEQRTRYREHTIQNSASQQGGPFSLSFTSYSTTCGFSDWFCPHHTLHVTLGCVRSSTRQSKTRLFILHLTHTVFSETFTRSQGNLGVCRCRHLQGFSTWLSPRSLEGTSEWPTLPSPTGAF